MSAKGLLRKDWKTLLSKRQEEPYFVVIFSYTYSPRMSQLDSVDIIYVISWIGNALR